MVGVDGKANMIFSPEKLGVHMSGEDYTFNVNLDVVKPRVWHCDDGKLQMGIENNFTYYWSYTNLAFTGTLTLDGKAHQIEPLGWTEAKGSNSLRLETDDEGCERGRIHHRTNYRRAIQLLFFELLAEIKNKSEPWWGIVLSSCCQGCTIPKTRCQPHLHGSNNK